MGHNTDLLCVKNLWPFLTNLVMQFFTLLLFLMTDIFYQFFSLYLVPHDVGFCRGWIKISLARNCHHLACIKAVKTYLKMMEIMDLTTCYSHGSSDDIISTLHLKVVAVQKNMYIEWMM